jgi:hypothetical protein
MRRLAGWLAALFLLVLTAALHAEDVHGNVVRLEKGKLIVATADKEQLSILLRGVELLDAEGRVVRGRDILETFRRETKVKVSREGDKVTSVRAIK